MKIFLQFFLFQIPIIWLNSEKISDKLIVDYFTKIKPVHHVILFSCHPFALSSFSTEGIFIQTIEFTENLNITNILVKESAHPWGVYLDTKCFFPLLEQASHWEYLNSSYFWLITGENISILNGIFNIALNSQITFVQDTTLIDVFSYGRHIEFNLTMKPFGDWKSEKGIKIYHKFPSLYRKDYRGDFHQLTLRQTVVIAKRFKGIRNIEIFDEIMNDKKSVGMLMLVKFHHNLGRVLREYYNYRVHVNRIAKDLNGKYIRGLRSGGLGVLKRNESDVSSTGAIPFRCRIDEFDFLHTRLMFRSHIFYRLTPELTKNSEKITFMVPLDQNAWLSIGTFIILTMTILVFITFFYDNDFTDSAVVVQTIGIFTGQGFGITVESFKARMTIFCALICFLVVSSFYSSQLLNVILLPPVDKIENANQLVATGIPIWVTSTFGIRLELASRFNQTNRRYKEENYEEVGNTNKENTVFYFNNHALGLDYMKYGHIGYAGESSSLQGFMRKKLSPIEICETRRQPILLAPQYHVLRKRSQYTQAFMIGLLKADEVGILQKIKNQFYDEMPPCTAGVKLYSVPFAKVKGAFYVLWGGMAASFLVFLIELKFWKMFCPNEIILVDFKETKMN